MRPRCGVAFPVALAVACLWGGVAQGQTAGAAPAEALFRAARERLAAGDVAAACEKFAESQRLDPQPGTLINLAACHEKQGKTARAWAEYGEAAVAAQRAGQAPRQRVARERASALEPLLARVLLRAADPRDLRIELDGQELGAAVLDTPIPVDPGTHVLRVSAPGKTESQQTFVIEARQKLPITLAPLEPLPASPPVAGPVTPAPPAKAAPATGSIRAPVGYSLVGTAAVLVGVGSYFGLRAFSDKSAIEGGCTPSFSRCTEAGQGARGDIQTAELASSLFYGAGVLAAGAGAYLLFWRTSPEQPPREVGVVPVASPTGGGVVLRASW